jgi:uncharacterized coiled-coil DUF342 family protein
MQAPRCAPSNTLNTLPAELERQLSSLIGELDDVKRQRDTLAHEASTTKSENDTVRTSASAYSKAVVSSTIELQRTTQTIDQLKDELDEKDQALVRAQCTLACPVLA